MSIMEPVFEFETRDIELLMLGEHRTPKGVPDSYNLRYL